MGTRHDPPRRIVPGSGGAFAGFFPDLPRIHRTGPSDCLRRANCGHVLALQQALERGNIGLARVRGFDLHRSPVGGQVEEPVPVHAIVATRRDGASL